jgi:rhamnose transport system permease protein
LKNSRELRALILLIIVVVAAAIKSPRLLEAASINSILLWIPLLIVMAVGQMLVIVSRGIDVSIGSTLALSGLTVGFLFRANPQMSLVLGSAIGLGMGILAGFINGALIGWAKIPPIIATLGTLSAYRGLAFIIARGGQVYRNDVPNDLTQWSIQGPLKLGAVTVPWLLVIALVVIALAYLFTARMVTGRYIFAVGSNAEAAHMHGLHVSRLIVLTYTICGALAGLGGVLYLSRFGFLNPSSAGSGMELTVIAATVIGGCDVRGGSGSVAGVLIGCTLLGAINVALSVVGIASDWQLLVYGAVILVALGMDGLLTRRATA